MLAQAPIPCPNCDADVGGALERGDEYCVACGFEIRKCRHCGADIRDAVRGFQKFCPACNTALAPPPRPLPDDEFWTSKAGTLVRALIFLCALCALVAVAIVGVNLLSQWIASRR